MSSVAEKLQRKVQRSGARQAGAAQARLHRLLVGREAVVPDPVSLGIVLIVATFLIWIVLNSTGIFASSTSSLHDILGDAAFCIVELVRLGKVMVLRPRRRRC